jgi:hypothetical protein
MLGAWAESASIERDGTPVSLNPGPSLIESGTKRGRMRLIALDKQIREDDAASCRNKSGYDLQMMAG